MNDASSHPPTDPVRDPNVVSAPAEDTPALSPNAEELGTPSLASTEALPAPPTPLPAPPPLPGHVSNGTPLAIEVHNLSRWFEGGVHAVRNISFAIPKGQVVGFVGANGAGKTTTMRILATLDYPSAGEAKVFGQSTSQYPEIARRHLGWMPDHYGTYSNMTVLEYLDFFARALGYHKTERIERIAEVMEFTNLTTLADRLIDKLSKGMGQRLCLGRALLHDPDLLILDEPAAGLDPKARVELKHLIRILADEGKTVFISSHILSELDEMCHSLLFINQGTIIHHGTSESLRMGKSSKSRYRVALQDDPEKLRDWAMMSPLVSYIDATQRGGRIEIDSVDPVEIAAVLRRMVTDGLVVTDFHQEERRLEDAFIEILGEIEASGVPTVS